MTIQLADFVATLIGVALLMAVWFRLWRPFTLDRLRYDLFVIRDDLFDRAYAGENGLSFESPFYLRTRQELNMLIRFCRDTSITQTLIAHCIKRACRVPETFEALPVPSEAEREILALVKHRQSTAMVRYLLLSSPIVWVFLVAVLLGSITILIPAIVKRELDTVLQVFKKAVANRASGLEYEAGQRILVDAAFFGRRCA
jgi:hypothetical protein